MKIPPNQPHQMRNDLQEDVEFLIISQPTIKEIESICKLSR